LKGENTFKVMMETDEVFQRNSIFLRIVK
jgi:hypothetical protein